VALGGFHWQALVLAIWEQLFCLSMIILLLYIFKGYINSRNSLSSELAASSYAAFIIHPLVLVLITAAVSDIKLHPLLKVASLSGPAIIFSFLAGSLLRRFPVLRGII
jgi:hypothetical protein